MSESIDLFFKSQCTLEEFLPWASRNLELEFKGIEGERYFGCYCEYLDTSLFLERNEWKTMDYYDLEGFNLHIDMDAAGDLRIMFFVVLAGAIMAKLEGADRAMLFWNCIPVANYVRDERGILDEISGKPVILPNHFREVFALIAKYH